MEIIMARYFYPSKFAGLSKIRDKDQQRIHILRKGLGFYYPRFSSDSK